MSNNYRKLGQCFGVPITRGTVLRVPGKPPLEPIVDLMFVYFKDELSLIVATGYKAGRVLAYRFASEAYVPATGMISSEWLYQNWQEAVFDDCEAADVLFIGKYPPPSVGRD